MTQDTRSRKLTSTMNVARVWTRRVGGALAARWRRARAHNLRRDERRTRHTSYSMNIARTATLGVASYQEGRVGFGTRSIGGGLALVVSSILVGSATAW